MTDVQFAHKVAKLNYNVLHLCYTQNVSLELLQPARTLHNILLLLNTEVSDLGRYIIVLEELEYAFSLARIYST
jgi:beclin 1-associated autophagy-related key regulator